MWFRWVLQRSGLPSAYALEHLIDGDHLRNRPSTAARPRKWDGYKRGVLPRDKHGSRNPIEQAEAKFAGTARVFRSALWDLLRGETLNKEQIEAGLRQLDPGLAPVLFKDADASEQIATTLRPIDAERLNLLVSIGTFDSLAAIVLLIGLSEAIASVELRELALQAYLDSQRRLLSIPEYRTLYEELFSHIDARCKHWTFLSPSQRMAVFIPFQGYQQYLDKREIRKDGELQAEVMAPQQADPEV